MNADALVAQINVLLDGPGDAAVRRAVVETIDRWAAETTDVDRLSRALVRALTQERMGEAIRSLLANEDGEVFAILDADGADEFAADILARLDPDKA